VDTSSALDALGISLPTPAYLIGLVIFGVIGYAVYRFGRKSARPIMIWGGIALMLYPYLVAETWLLYAVGTGLCATLFVLRNR
jgi:hypothetical protein